jgi:RNA polymerase sigma factor (sigma-70 family)
MGAGSRKSDADLVADALLGAKEPLAELVTRHWGAAVFLAGRVLGSPDLARDAAQEAAIAAMTDLGRLRSPERFGAWFCGIALNVARRWLRQLRAEVITAPADRAAMGPGPAEIAEAADTAGRVRNAVAALPSGQQNAVLLFYLQGLSHREVAAELGISVGAVKSRLHQARAALAPRLVPIIDAPSSEALTSEAPISEAPVSDSQEVISMPDEQATEWVTVSVAEIRRAPDRDGEQPEHVMILRESGGERQLPIWIGPAEAIAMALVLESAEFPRPFTHRLAVGLVQAGGARLTEVRITRLTGPVFYSAVIVEGPDGPQQVDARPSDAVNLALVAEVPIRVERSLFGEAQPVTPATAARSLPVTTAQIAAEAQQRMADLSRSFGPALDPRPDEPQAG